MTHPRGESVVEVSGRVAGPGSPTPRVRIDPGDDIARQIVDTSSRHMMIDGTDAVGDRVALPASELRSACLDLARRDDSPGLRVVNARITGQLDLRALTLPLSVKFIGCSFEQAPRLEGAHLHELVIAGPLEAHPHGATVLGSTLPGLRASGLRVDRDLILSGTLIDSGHRSVTSLSRSAAVWLTEASIGGRLLAVRTMIDTHADRAIQADRTMVTGDVRLIRGFVATAELRWIGAQIGGSLDLTGATLMPRDGRALDIADATLGGGLFLLDDPDYCIRPRVLGRIDMSRAEIHGQVMFRDADLQAPDRGHGGSDYSSPDTVGNVAVSGQGLDVHGALTFEGDSNVLGALYLAGSRLRAGAVLDGALLRNHGHVALDLSQAELGASLSLRDATVEGQVNLANARIGGPLSMRRLSVVAPPEGRAIAAINSRIEGDVWMARTRVNGGSVNFRGAQIQGVLDADAAEIVHPGDRTLSLHQARVGGNVRLCTGFRSIGVLVLNRVEVSGRLRCDGGTFAWTGPRTDREIPQEPNERHCAVEAISATFASGTGLGWSVLGAVDLTDATTSVLADRPGTDWPERAYLDGFDFERFAPVSKNEPAAWDAGVRCRWLSGIGCDDPNPWEQVAAVLRNNGDVTGAEQILIGFRRSLRRRRVGPQQHWWRRLGDALADYGVGYGFRPQRAALFMGVLLVAVFATLTAGGGAAAMRASNDAGVIFTPTGAAPATMQPAGVPFEVAGGACGHGSVRCFNPAWFTIDTVVPIIDLHQRATWYPSLDDGGRWLEWWLDLCTLLGWLASSVFVLSLARLGSSRTV